MKKISNVIAAIMIALGIYVTFKSSTFPQGSSGSPGPGLFPAALGILLLIFSSAVLIQQIKSSAKAVAETDEENEEPNMKYVWITLFVLTAYIVLMNIIGFIVSTILFLLALLLILKVKSKPTLVLVPLLTTTAIWYIFEELLSVFLPTGILF